MNALQEDVKAIGAALKEKPDLLNAELKTKFGNVRNNLFVLTRDGSRGAHNFEYATKIMNEAGKDLGEVKAVIK
jgi:hypothetical protein